MTSLFFSYSHADEALRDQLEKHLAAMRRQSVIETWHDRRIGAGQDFGAEIDAHVDTDDIILLLVSPDFLASDYCYDLEMQRAIARHQAHEAIVIPVILRPCDWHDAPFGRLQATPRDGKPVTLWVDRDEAFLQVARSIRAAVQRLKEGARSRAAHDPREDKLRFLLKNPPPGKKFRTIEKLCYEIQTDEKETKRLLAKIGARRSRGVNDVWILEGD